VRTTLKLLLVAILCCVPAAAQTAVISGQAVNQYGQPVPFAQVRVCNVTLSGNPCDTTGVTLYQDYTRLTPIGNPASADQYGNYLIYVGALASPNLYLVQLSPAAGITFNYGFNGPFLSASGGTITGNLVVTGIFTAGTINTLSTYEVNGSQIASSNLADGSNLAKLNASNIFTGATQTAPIFNATTQFQVNGIQIASANLSDGSNLAKLNAANVFTGSPQTVNVLNATTVNSAGYLVGSSGGSAGQVLCSNGSSLNSLCTVYSPSNTPFYQTVKSLSTSMTQRLALEFTGRFALTDSASPSQTGVDLNGTGTGGKAVTATAAGAAGNCGFWTGAGDIGDSGVPCAPQIETISVPAGSTCTTSGASDAVCTFLVTWPAAFPNTNYTVTCTAGALTAGTVLIGPRWSNKTTTGVTITIQNGTNDGALATNAPVDCTGIA
jgi:hypothetical protein